MRSEATTVDQYLSSLPEARREAVAAVREEILAHLPEGYEEVMNWGMITYQVPLASYPETYNGKPLMYAALASQKQYMAVYLSGIYVSEEGREQFEAAYHATGKRLDAGKSCVRFRKLDDLPLALIGQTIGSLEVSQFIEIHQQSRKRNRRRC